MHVFRFHPAFHRLEEIIQSGELRKVKTVKSELAIPWGYFSRDDVRFEFDLGGGSLMDMGVYSYVYFFFCINSQMAS